MNKQQTERKSPIPATQPQGGYSRVNFPPDTITSGSVTTHRSDIRESEPAMTDTLHRLHGFLNQAADSQNMILQKLRGPALKCGDDLNKNPNEPSIEDLLQSAEAKAAELAGAADTINQRL